MSVYWEQRGRHHHKIDASDSRSVSRALAEAARALQQASAILVVAGAGMGVDSGVPDFRGGRSFWEHLNHPKIKRYEDMSNSAWFDADPELAWGLNFHQMRTYREVLGFARCSVLPV